MKKKILALALTAFIVGTMVAGCQSSAKKVEKDRENLQEAKDNVVEAKQELNQALKDSIMQFKQESGETISNNEKSILELKAQIAKENKVTKAKYEKIVADLEQKNAAMKSKLDAYQDIEQDKWASFKREFKHDMDELGNALKDITINNKK